VVFVLFEKIERTEMIFEKFILRREREKIQCVDIL